MLLLFEKNLIDLRYLLMRNLSKASQFSSKIFVFLIENLNALKKRKIIVYNNNLEHFRIIKCKFINFCIKLNKTRVFAKFIIRA